MTGATSALARAARAIRCETLPGDALFVAKHCVLDWLGVALGGSREPLSRMLLEEIREQGGAPQATLLGHAEKAPSLLAALVNGSAGHALDFDDTHLAMLGHPTAPVLPAVLALAEERGASGAGALAAFVAGVETECRLGTLLGPGHYTTGFHSTGTVGTFGAAAACAHLLGLDEERWAHALGIAGTQAAGLKAVFGTMSKPFHAGRAAMSGLLAARLAARGFTSHPAIVEVDQGFAATHGGRALSDTAFRVAERLPIVEMLFKYHASCYLTHAAIESILRLKDEHGLAAGGVERIEVFVPPGHLKVCNIENPRTGLEGKFSLRTTVAMALLGDDTSDPAAFSDSRMRDPALVRARDLVAVTASRDLGEAAARVVVGLERGERLEAATDTGVPAADLDRQWQRLTAKFVALAAPVVGADRASRLHSLVGRLETVEKLSDLTELCCG